MLTKKDLVRAFSALAIGGSTVMVHSKPSALGPVEGGAQTIFDALEEAVLPGQIVWPTFSFALAQGEPFSYRETPSVLGSLTEIARKRYLRFGHPIWSFACRAPHLLMSPQQLHTFDAFSPESAFGQLTMVNGQIMIIGLPWNTSWTYVHYIEQYNHVPWRYPKIFTGLIDGIDRACLAWVHPMTTKTNVEPMGHYLEQRGVVKVTRIGDAIVKLVSAVDCFNLTSEVIAEDRGRGMLYEYA